MAEPNHKEGSNTQARADRPYMTPLDRDALVINDQLTFASVSSVFFPAERLNANLSELAFGCYGHGLTPSLSGRMAELTSAAVAG